MSVAQGCGNLSGNKAKNGGRFISCKLPVADKAAIIEEDRICFNIPWEAYGCFVSQERPESDLDDTALPEVPLHEREVTS